MHDGGMLDPVPEAAPPRLTLRDDPFLPRGLGSMRFDGENLALQKRTLIEGDVFETDLADNYFGRKLGLPQRRGHHQPHPYAGGGGRVVKPLNEMNLTGNFIDLWTRLDKVGGDNAPSSAWRIPSLLFRGLQLSGS